MRSFLKVPRLNDIPVVPQGSQGGPTVLSISPLSISPSSERRANARNVSTSLLPYGGITYFINSFDYTIYCASIPH